MTKKKSKGIMVIFDGDIVAYRAAAAAMTTQVEIKHLKSGKTKNYKNITAFKKFLQLKGIEYVPDDYSRKTIATSAPARVPCAVIDAQIKKIVDFCFGDDFRIFVSGEDNFRDTLPLPEKYKDNRKENVRPPTLDACKEHMVSEYNAVKSNGMETDDMVIIAARHYVSKGYEVILVTNDKDAYAYGDMCIYNYTTEGAQPEPIDSFGELHINDKKVVKGSGFKWLCFQLLNGDTADHFKPSQLSGIEFGEKSAYKLLVDCSMEQECWDVVCKTYKEWYPEVVFYDDWMGTQWSVEWKDLLQLYFYCAKMKETMNDDLNIDSFIKAKGLVWNE